MQGKSPLEWGETLSIHLSINPSIRPSFGWSLHPLSKGSEGQLEGSEGLLEGSKGLAEWSEGLPEGSEGLLNGSEARPQGILTALPSLSAFSHVGCSQESIHRIERVIVWVQSSKSINSLSKLQCQNQGLIKRAFQTMEVSMNVQIIDGK